ncbi:ribonuclease E/G [Alkalilacustris brevis]|uniref:ribonuclease E/G n=1 Tax=Alkalilacustris brevis TaxID=2026338 RepID=UPI000E0CF1AB|nr:ribonuclease E/G [Alkalilacustris brevis]
MKGVAVLLGQMSGRTAAVRMIDGALDDLFIDPPESAGPAPETLFRGTVGRPVKGLGGVFVDLPGGASGFLRQVKGLRPGQPILVQVSSHAEPGKAVPLTTRLLLKGRYAIITPDAPGLNIARGIQAPETRQTLQTLAARAMAGAQPDLGLILRSAAEDAETADVSAEIAELRTLSEAILADVDGPPALLLAPPDAHHLAWREWAQPAPDTMAEGPDALARHGADEAITALLHPEVPLPGGAGMVIEPTRALIAVDINTGHDTSPAAGLKANIAAARELPRQLRLRGLGGQVTVDFAPMPRRDRQVLEQSLRAAFRRSAAETSLAGWTPLGHYELQRRRDRLPLATSLAPQGD